MATLGIHTKYKTQETSKGRWICFKEHRAMNNKWWRAGWLDGVCGTIVKRFPRRRMYIDHTIVHLGNRGIWHTKLIPARLEGLMKAPGARGEETDETGNLSRGTDVRVRHAAF